MVATATAPPQEATKELDGWRLVIKTSPAKAHVFLDRRMGITWPSAANRGYIAVYGLLDEKFKPFVLLSERTDFLDVRDMIKKAYITAMDYHCSGMYADLGDEYSSTRNRIMEYGRRLRSDAPGIHDASEWASIERALPSIEAANEDYALVLPEGTQIEQEYSAMRPDIIHIVDRVQPWQRFPAMHALSLCICSWDMYPFHRPEPKLPEISRGEGY